jgi:hypothetical protein
VRRKGKDVELEALGPCLKDITKQDMTIEELSHRIANISSLI